MKRKMYLDWKEYENNGTSEHEEIHRAWVSSIKKGKLPLKNYRQRIGATLYPHQIEAVRRSFYRNEYALFMEQGTGKTYCAIELILQRQVKTLVVCPKAVKFTWEREIKKFGAKADVINFRSLHKIKEFYNFIIVDESQKIKNPFSKQSKLVQNLAQNSTYRLLLTGTPYGNKLLDIFGQFMFLNPRIFGLYKKDFLSRYCVMNPFTPFPKIDGYKRVGEIQKKIKAFSYVVKKKDVLDLPDMSDEYIYIPQSDEYKQFKKKNVVTLNDTKVSLEHKLQLSSKLQQLCSGFIFHTDEQEEKETFHITPNKKLETLKDLIEDIEGKVVIFTKFQPSLKDVKNMLGDCYVLDGSTKSTDDMEELFNNDNKHIIVNIQSGGLGINLQTSNTVIFYDLTFSYLDYTQARARVHRIGQEHECTYYHLVTEQSVEEEILFQALKRKKDYADLFVKS